MSAANREAALKPLASNFLRTRIRRREMRNQEIEGSAPLAQLVEQLTLNQWVPGSSP